MLSAWRSISVLHVFQLRLVALPSSTHPTLPRSDWARRVRDRVRDTVVVAAEVVTVAEEKESSTAANEFDVTPRIKTDTLHWPAVRLPNGRPIVCGFATEDVDLGSWGRFDNVHFLGGASHRSLLSTVDSIRLVRGVK